MLRVDFISDFDEEDKLEAAIGIQLVSGEPSAPFKRYAFVVKEGVDTTGEGIICLYGKQTSYIDVLYSVIDCYKRKDAIPPITDREKDVISYIEANI